MHESKNSANVNDYTMFRARYLRQFSANTLNYFELLEQKESWSITVDMSELVQTFNKLPAVCEYPIKPQDLNLIVKLIRLLAYLPFKESITALAWLGFEHEEYGFVIYKVAYDALDDGSSDYTHAHTIIERTKVMNRIATVQQTLGRKL
ncbi:MULTISPECIES: hypothetical protein [Vibrio]|uniref:hypothetical protein n=1 Tax=Vibrio TaxID=662 RepID=UPI0004DF8E52|nr:hypothetical protein [Vibrio parahaemolyticus]EGQ9239492.1 hypothetical protein [Vibrio vulnificus]EHD1698134.1 hypothetical protein [Vibrio vulnificus]EKZ9225863.1 hypothetical protein [Vibrio vulnificus]ELC9582705.1 hypothetical protein [Vibrio vulnificus]MCU8149758.1 hypothetical protein [Vibrio vulnificus]